MPTRKQLHRIWESQFEHFVRDENGELQPKINPDNRRLSESKGEKIGEISLNEHGEFCITFGNKSETT